MCPARVAWPSPSLYVWQCVAVSRAEPVREVTMTEGDLEGVAVLFGALKALSGLQSPLDDARLASVFDNHVRTVIQGLKSSLDELTDPFLRQAQILAVRCRGPRRCRVPVWCPAGRRLW